MSAKAKTRGRTSEQAERVAAIRAFNRFYTKKLGLLGRGLLGTDHTLSEARIIWEIAQRDGPAEVTAIRRDLDLDPGYLSRILARFERNGLVIRKRSQADRRRQLVLLTGSGRATFRALDSRSSSEFRELLDEHPEAEQRRLVEALGDVRAILHDPAASGQVTLREPESGDHGWVLERHAVVYSAERGWGERFEALCAKVVADFVASRDLRRERCWIAELDGVRCGSTYCTMRSETVAQIRLLLVEPWARGAGAGSALVAACVDFARRAGYEQIMLWTNSRLTSARRIYESFGFELRSEEPNQVFSSGVGQEFWLHLRD